MSSARGFTKRIRQRPETQQRQTLFLLLVTVHAKAFFTLVSSHLVAFTFFSAGHLRKFKD